MKYFEKTATSQIDFQKMVDEYEFTKEQEKAIYNTANTWGAGAGIIPNGLEKRVHHFAYNAALDKKREELGCLE